MQFHALVEQHMHMMPDGGALRVEFGLRSHVTVNYPTPAPVRTYSTVREVLRFAPRFLHKIAPYPSILVTESRGKRLAILLGGFLIVGFHSCWASFVSVIE